MLKLSGKLGKALAALSVFGAALAVANADLSGNAFYINASNSDGSATYVASLQDMSYDSQTNTWTWSLGAPVELVDGESGNTIGWLTGGNAYVSGDPSINFGFAVQAGSADTTFTINTASLSFPTIANPQAQAGAAFTITDTDHTGATFNTGNGKAYTADTDGGNFAKLVGSFSAGSGHSASSDENKPAFGYDTLGYSVSSMSSGVSFTLSANDLASGTNSFEVIPEPSTLALVALGALSMLRRR